MIDKLRNIKILILANSASGFYSFRKELLIELVKLGYEVYLSLPFDNRVYDLEKLGVKFIDTPIDRRGTNPITDFKLYLFYRKLIKHLKPKTVLTYTIKPNLYGGLACRFARVKYLTNITGLGSALENEGILQKVTIHMYKSAMKRVSTIFFQNKANRQFFIDNKIALSAKQILIPGSGVNLMQYKPLDYTTDDIVKFVFISRLLKEKGIEDYIEAAKSVKLKYPNTEFHICGSAEDNYIPYIKQLEEDGIIIFHGQVKDVSVIHKNIHCLVHPSYYPEGMSNVLLEACASARPIITTNRPGCGEIVEDKITGYIVKEKSPTDLADKIEFFLNLSHEDKFKMGQEARLKVEKEFDRQIVVDTYLDNI